MINKEVEGYVIACSGDPVLAARELTRSAVIGIAKATYALS